MRRAVLMALATALLTVSPAFADVPFCRGDADIYYVNGVQNNEVQAKFSRGQLQILVEEAIDTGCQVPDVYLNWNKTEGLSKDLVQAREQLAKGVSLDDPDLLDFIEDYRRSIGLGRKVVVVAHSQGNLYANKAFDVLAGDPIDVNAMFGIIALATPASYVAGQPFPCGDLCKYVTLAEDLVASEFPLINLGVLTANTSNQLFCPLLSSCHNFVDNYVNGSKSRAKIILYLQLALPKPASSAANITPPISTTGMTDPIAWSCAVPDTGFAIRFYRGDSGTSTIDAFDCVDTIDSFRVFDMEAYSQGIDGVYTIAMDNSPFLVHPSLAGWFAEGTIKQFVVFVRSSGVWTIGSIVVP